MKKVLIILLMSVSLVGFSQSKKEKQLKKEISKLSKKLDFSKEESSKILVLQVTKYNEWKAAQKSDTKKEDIKESRKKYYSSMKELLGKEKFKTFKVIEKEMKAAKRAAKKLKNKE
jgi:hypothetical protein